MNGININKRTYRNYFSSLGFEANPFEYTNADQEDRLPNYFTPPPYFNNVFGDPKHPKSFVVFAPRGGGKSAQRRMIENKCSENNVLAITYDQFEFPGMTNLSEITLAYHLINIIRNILFGLFLTIHCEPEQKEKLNKEDREILVKLSAEYLVGINGQTITQSIDSLKSLKNKFHDFWNEWLPFFKLGVKNLLNNTINTDIGNLEQFFDPNSGKAIYQKYNLKLLSSIAQKIGYKAIYILIDRVDEADFTGNDFSASFTLIEPMLRDLDLLETGGVAFKFFLWDQIEPLYRKIARTDRIRQETLEWDDEMLLEMWKKRLREYSNNKISSLSQIASPSLPDIDTLCLIFANRSPRDMVRIGDQIFAEEIEIQQADPQSSYNKIKIDAIERGLEKFCSLRANEILSQNNIRDLRKIPQVDFTIPFLANEIFREKQATTRNRILRWRSEGAIIDVDRVDNPNPASTTQVKLLAIQDVRIAKVMFSQLNIIEFLKSKYKKCPKCGATLLRDWGEKDSVWICHECQFDLSTSSNDSWELWKRKESATEARKRFRQEQAMILQPELFTDIMDSDDDHGEDE